jgi:hypothetical protein
MFSNLRELWVSHKLFTVTGNPLLHVATKEVARKFREFEWDASTMLAETGEPVIVARGERGTVIAGAGSGAREDDDGASRFSYGIDFKPDLSLLGTAETETYLKALFARDPQFSPDPKDAQAVDRADAIALYFIEQALDKIENGEPVTFDNHLTKYVDFLRKVRANREKYTLESRGLGHLNIEDVLREVDGEPTQKLVKKAGEHLYGILAGTDNALQIIFEGNLANGKSNNTCREQRNKMTDRLGDRFLPLRLLLAPLPQGWRVYEHSSTRESPVKDLRSWFGDRQCHVKGAAVSG